jgi:type IV pilus assembly protein PilX
MSAFIPLRSVARQHGAVLAVSLLFLVILMLLAVTAMTAATMEERMAGNTRDTAIAFQAAEAALRDARRDLNGIAATGTYGRPSRINISQFGDGSDTDNGSCNNLGLCRPLPYSKSLNSILPSAPNVNMTAAPSVQYGTYTGAPQLQGVSAQPRYIIEYFCLQYLGTSAGASAGASGATSCSFFRITARGYGGNPNTEVTLQEIFLRI